MHEYRFGVWLRSEGGYQILYYCAGWTHDDDLYVPEGLTLIIGDLDYETVRKEAEVLAAINNAKVHDAHEHKMKGERNEGRPIES